MYRLALVMVSVVMAGAANSAEPYTKQMLREDVSSSGAVITFPREENSASDSKPKRPMYFGGMTFKRLKACKNDEDIFGDRCSFSDAVVQPTQAFFDAIRPIIW